MSATRTIRTGGMFFDGMTGYAVVPITFYGWKEFTIAEWIYPVFPKANVHYSKFSMIGDSWVDKPAVLSATENRYEYGWLHRAFNTRRPDGTAGSYIINIVAHRNRWVHITMSFSLADRILKYYVNGSLAHTYTIPSTERTILEWDPATATYPSRYRNYVLGANSYGDERMRVIYGSVRIYSRRLTDSEVMLIYQRDEPIREGLELWLPFYENTGNIIRDVSGKNRHATAYGGFMWVVKPSTRQLASTRVLSSVR